MLFLNKYSPKDFKVTKDQLYLSCDKHIDMKTILAIMDWKDWVCKKQKVNQGKSSHWEQYPYYYLKKVVKVCDVWPNDLPIGYVFISLVLSTQTEIITLDDHKEMVDVFMESNGVNSEMVDCFKSGKFYRHGGKFSNEIFNGMDQASLLYGEH